MAADGSLGRFVSRSDDEEMERLRERGRYPFQWRDAKFSKTVTTQALKGTP
jgi:hypothetical protein